VEEQGQGRQMKQNIHVAQKNEYSYSIIEFIYAACAVFGPETQLVKFIKLTCAKTIIILRRTGYIPTNN